MSSTKNNNYSSSEAEELSQKSSVSTASASSDDETYFCKKSSSLTKLIQLESSTNFQKGDMKILQSQRFLENIKCQHNYNSIVYESILRYLFEFTSVKEYILIIMYYAF